MYMKIIIANWKMYLPVKDAIVLAKKIKTAKTKNKVIIAPSFPIISAVKKVCGALDVASQDVSWADYGAYTGEVAAVDLKELGCQYAIIAHSERRKYANETYERANTKIIQSQKAGLTPVLCVGESIEEKRAGKTLEVVKNQLKVALKNIDTKNFIIAYEPIWAIGTGNPENPQNANMVQGEIKKQVGDVPVLYGGSVDKDNFASFLAEKNIDGLLVGGASTKWEQFKKIIGQ